MINRGDILETIKMISEEHLDIRTITMGISLLSCAGSDVNAVCDKVYEKITKAAKNLVSVAEEISVCYGVPIINKRISVTPASLVLQSDKKEDFVKFACTLDRAAESLISGFSSQTNSWVFFSSITIIPYKLLFHYYIIFKG